MLGHGCIDLVGLHSGVDECLFLGGRADPSVHPLVEGCECVVVGGVACGGAEGLPGDLVAKLGELGLGDAAAAGEGECGGDDECCDCFHCCVVRGVGL
mgnify:CR=1 FL=1